MKFLVVFSIAHKVYKTYFKERDVINSEEITLNQLHDFMKDTNPSIGCILITDEAISCDIQKTRQDILSLLQWMHKEKKSEMKVLMITKDYMTAVALESLCEKYEALQVVICDFIRISKPFMKDAIDSIAHERIRSDNRSEKPEETKKPSLLNRFMSRKKEERNDHPTEPLRRDFDHISRGISKVIAITGHRGSGLTGTAVNIAYEACKRGLSAIVIDMDIAYRGMNMYFGGFSEEAKSNEELNASFVRTLARPQDYMTTAYNVKDKLWLVSLGYSFSDQKLVDQFYTGTKLVGLLSVLKNKFNMVVLDFPMNQFRNFGEILIHMDTLGLCVPNNLYDIVSTLRNIELVFGRENASYVNAKSRVIVTKYNDRARFQKDILTPDRVIELLTSGINDNFVVGMKAAGCIPFCKEFDEQIETDVPLVNSSVEYENAYGRVLLRLLEGADEWI